MSGWLRATAAADAIVLLAGVVAAIAIGVDSAKYPSEWDDRVLDLVAFVEDARGLEFRHPVHVDFLTPEEYTEAVTVAAEDLTDDEIADLELFTAIYRATGMVEADFDPVQALNDLSDEGTLAFYSPGDKRIVVRGTELDTELRVTLVHELTHALQDQQFDLGFLDRLDDSDSAVAYRGLVEGDALRIERRYIDQLPDEEREAYETSVDDGFDHVLDGGLGDVPPALLVSFAVPYGLGGAFVTTLENHNGATAIDDAFEHPPLSGLELMNPWAYLEGADPPREVTLPEAADGVEIPDYGEDVFGAIDLYLMLAQRIDPPGALAASDTWGGGGFRLEEEGQGEGRRTCVSLGFVGSPDRGPEPLHHVLGLWRDTMPAEAEVTVERVGDQVNVRSCDPGTFEATADPHRLMTAMAIPAVRTYVYAEFLGFVDERAARCMATTVSARLRWDHYTDLDETFWENEEVTAIGEDAMQSCMA